jgi:hypothetical protein
MISTLTAAPKITDGADIFDFADISMVDSQKEEAYRLASLFFLND